MPEDIADLLGETPPSRRRSRRGSKPSESATRPALAEDSPRPPTVSEKPSIQGSPSSLPTPPSSPSLPPTEAEAKAAERALRRRAVLAQISTLDRGLFHKELGKVLACAPTAAALHEYAQKNPDRYYQALAIVARLAGYSERPEDGASKASLFTHISSMSDSELADRLAQMDAKLDELLDRKPAKPVVIEAEYRPS